MYRDKHASLLLKSLAALAVALGLGACGETANSANSANPAASTATPPAAASAAPGAERNGIEVTVVGTFSDQAEDANGQREDGCSLNFIVDNRSALDLKSFQGSFDVFKVSNGAPLKPHFPLTLTELAAGSSQTSPPDVIHSARCEDMKVVIKRSTCRQDTQVDCPSLRYTAQGVASVEVSKS